jgi:FG-GAP repeat protein
LIRSAFATAAAVAAVLALGVSAAAAAPRPGTPLTKIAARDHLKLPRGLAGAINQRLGKAPRMATASAGQAPAQQQELQASDGMPGDFFGYTVSLTADGQTALVGAPDRAVGAAYVFVKHGGKWSEQQEIDSPGGAAQDTYGLAVSLSGDGQTALVGAPTGDGGNGIVYSYERQGGKYVLDGRITASDGAYGDEFGVSVSLSGLGNVALISAIDHDGYQGAAYVFVNHGKSWTEQREYQDPVAPGEAYGYSVSEAADGLVGVVGAPFANGGQGAAYVFSELGSSQHELVGSVASTDPPTSLFGLSVSIDALGTRVLVGSPSANYGDGAAFVYDQTWGGWTQSQELVQSNPSGADLFGYSVALDYLGNVALIGATERNGTAGSAFVFAGNGTLAQQRELAEPGAEPGDEYGFSTAVDALGDQLLIGAPYAPYSGTSQGEAWAVANPIG